MQEEKKEFAVRALNRIKQVLDTHIQLRALGVNLIDLEDGLSLLEEAIVLLFVSNDADFEKALADVQWWLYDNVNKIIYAADKTEIDVTEPEAFISWLEGWYNKNNNQN